jgi:hypothetical protein
MADALDVQNSKNLGMLTQHWPHLVRVVHPAIFSTSLSLLLVCGCASGPHSRGVDARDALPADEKMDKDAGRGNWLFVTLRLESGEELPFFFDTGASDTCFDKSMEPLLGERLGTASSWHFGAKNDAGIYAAPDLYLGGSLLQMTGTNVATIDLAASIESYVGHPVAGVLGMDVLEHYCIQLDFQANKIRFLDSSQADKQNWGKSYALTNRDDAYPVLSANLVGGFAPGSLIDTGCNNDGWLGPGLFQQWTNLASPPVEGQAREPDGLFDGEKYSELELQRLDEDAASSEDSHMKVNGIGLRFLARHLVTIDFPNRTLYLKRTSVGPLSLPIKQMKAQGKSVYRFLANLKKRDRLPGWSTTDKLPRHAMFDYHTLSSGTLKFQKQGDSSFYFYWVTRPSAASSWELKKAWRKDANGRTLAEYPVPG